jgi:hypothetical protein
VAHMEQWVASWGQAEQAVFQPMGKHTERSYATYLRWFWPRARVIVTFMVLDLDFTSG